MNKSIVSKVFGLALAVAMLASSTAFAATEENVVKDKTVVGYSSMTSDKEDPKFAIDGDLSKKWCSLPDPTPRYIAVDLGGEYTIDSYELVNASKAATPEPDYLNTKAWELFVSMDGTTWTSVDKVTDNKDGETKRTISPVNAKFVKLQIDNPNQDADGYVRLYEFEVYGVPAVAVDARDVVLDKTVVGYSSMTSDKEAPQFAIDGDLGKKWCSLPDPTPRYIAVDLGGEYTIDSYELVNASKAATPEPDYLNTKAWELFVSMDGTTWTSVDKVTDNKDGETKRTISPVNAKFVKLQIDNPNQDADGYVRLYEFEVFGDPAKAVDTTEPATDTTTPATDTTTPATDTTKPATDTAAPAADTAAPATNPVTGDVSAAMYFGLALVSAVTAKKAFHK